MNLCPHLGRFCALRSCELVVQLLHAACATGVAATFSSLLGGVLLSLEARRCWCTRTWCGIDCGRIFPWCWDAVSCWDTQWCNDRTRCFMLFLPFLYFDLVCLLILRAKKWLSIWIVFGISLFHLPFHSSNPLVGTDAATDLHIPSVLGLLFGCRVWSCHNHRVTCQTHNGENQKIEDVKWQMILYTWYAVRET